MKPKPPNLDKPVPKFRLLSAEEKGLWDKAMESPEMPVHIQEASPPSIPVSLPKIKKLKTPAPPIYTLPPKKPVTFQATLDLHGFTLANAYPRLRQFIITSYCEHKRTVLVITGKGSLQGFNSLRAMLPLWLAEPELAPYIYRYSYAGTKQGGEGAWCIGLRKSF